jgi:uncharacterized membrane protein
MTELKAHLLIFAAMLIVMTGVSFVLASVNAGGTAYAVAMVLVGGGAAHASSLVVMHYGSSRQRRR